MATIAFFAGSFNPFTIGHQSVVERGLKIFDHIIIGVGFNLSKPESEKGAEERAKDISLLFADECRVSCVVYSGLTTDEALSRGATALLRGVRSVADFENERNLADINRRISGLETVLLFTLPEHSYISSSVVRELAYYDHDVSDLIAH